MRGGKHSINVLLDGQVEVTTTQTYSDREEVRRLKQRAFEEMEVARMRLADLERQYAELSEALTKLG